MKERVKKSKKTLLRGNDNKTNRVHGDDVTLIKIISIEIFTLEFFCLFAVDRNCYYSEYFSILKSK